MKLHTFILAAGLTAGVSSPGSSQIRPQPSVVFESSGSADLSELAPRSNIDFPQLRGDDYRWEGAAIGGILAAGTLTFIYARACEEDCLGGGVRIAVGSAIVGGFVGLLIGGAFPKPAE